MAWCWSFLFVVMDSMDSCFSVGGINGIWPFKSVVGTLQLLNRVPEQTAQS